MDIKFLEKKAAALRLKVLETIASAQKGHIGGGLSCMDILVALYYGNLLQFDPKNSNWEERDRFILSKGHVGSTLFVLLADLGFFDSSELECLNQGGMLGEHPDKSIPGVEIDSGSLGHGLGIGAGIALATKMDRKNFKTVVLLSDGECYEGSTWEAAMFAAHHQLDNLIAILDRNQQIVNDFTENVNRLDSLSEKWEAFGWEVREKDGHSFESLFEVFHDFHSRQAKRPLIVIANTIKGKGVSFMEGQLAWHHGTITGENLEIARKELIQLLEEHSVSF